MRSFKVPTDIYREDTKGEYYTDFSCIDYNMPFPNKETLDRTAVYIYREKQYDGRYGKNKYLHIQSGKELHKLKYRQSQFNYYNVSLNKVIDAICNGEYSLSTGNVDNDREGKRILNSRNWFEGIRSAYKFSGMTGDSYIKTYDTGVSAAKAHYCVKVVSTSDTNYVKGYITFQYVPNNKGVPYGTLVKFDVHERGKVTEYVKYFFGTLEYGGTIGKAVDYEYKDVYGNTRLIPAEGLVTYTGVDDAFDIQWFTNDKEQDGVYGTSMFQLIQSSVYTIEERLTIIGSLINNRLDQKIVTGMGMMIRDQLTGEWELKTEGKYLIMKNPQDVKPEILREDLDFSSDYEFLKIVKENMHEIMEIPATVFNNEYSGNPSEETLGNLQKTFLDRAGRLCIENINAVNESAYYILKRHGLDVKREDVNITIHIGRADSMKHLAEVAKLLVEADILSKRTLRKKLFNIDPADSDIEDEQMRIEKGQDMNNMNNTQVFPPLQENKEVDKDKDIITEDGKNKEQ